MASSSFQQACSCITRSLVSSQCHTHLLLHHGFELLSVLRVAEHPLEGLWVAHRLREVWVQHLLQVLVRLYTVKQGVGSTAWSHSATSLARRITTQGDGTLVQSRGLRLEHVRADHMLRWALPELWSPEDLSGANQMKQTFQ